MVMRSFEKRRYIVAGIITLLVFSLGVLLGFVIDAERLQYYQNVNQFQRLDYSSLQLQYAYINQLGEEQNCPVMLRTFDESVKSLESARIRLENYNRQSALNKADFELLRREYILAQLRYWLFAKQTKSLCNQDVVTILYFFSNQKSCPECEDQAFVLTYFKKLLGDRLLNFALDEQYAQEPMIQILKSSYLIEQYPTLIVEGQVLRGFTSTEDLMKVVCSNYGLPPEECTAYVPRGNETTANTTAAHETA